MSMYLKSLGIHVYFATIKDSYCLNGKNIEANAKAIHALKSTLNDEYLSRVSNIDSAFVTWNIITSLGEKDQYYAGSDSDVYLATIKDSYCLNGKNNEANTKALNALKSTLNDDYLSRVSNLIWLL